MTWWWLSFCAEPDGAFLGVVLVQARASEEAIRVVKALGCTPSVGAEVLAMSMPAQIGPPPAGYANRLLTECEM